MVMSPLGLPFTPTKNVAGLLERVSMREGVDKVGQLAGAKFVMKLEKEMEFATRMVKAGAVVYRSKQGANLGDFIIWYKGKTYAVEVGTAGKTAKQLRDVESTLGKDVVKLAGDYDEVAKEILGK
jgi:hypothetical protein